MKNMFDTLEPVIKKGLFSSCAHLCKMQGLLPNLYHTRVVAVNSYLVPQSNCGNKIIQKQKTKCTLL